MRDTRIATPLNLRAALALAVAGAWLASLAPTRAEDRVSRDQTGRLQVRPPPVADELRNPWPAAWEEEFWIRATHTIRFHQGGSYGNKFFENEKASYPRAMLDYLAGNHARAVAFLQAEDTNAGTWNKHTLGIDLFPSFTLKGQMRKYFYFGDALQPGYRERMKQAGQLWTERDPLHRPHPAYQGPGEGWTPEVRNSWADVRNTDNLRFMRDTSIYLMAEHTGNDATREVVLQRLQYEVWAMYNIGMGEWDSENYLGHSFTPWLNLYDFAADPDVKRLAKAALDWISAAAAVKYWRGGFNGPCKRDYYHPRVWAVPAASEFGLYFGDAPIPDPAPSRDHVHAITSAYRPPPAVVALARKQFPKPVELLISHPTYDHKRQDPKRPEFFETQYIANTFMLGTLPSGHTGDANGFKMLAFNSARGVDHFIIGTGNQPTRITTSTNGRDHLAQCRNLVIWLNADGNAPFHFLLPKSVALDQHRGVSFLLFEKTWVALHPINLGPLRPNDEATRTLNDRQKYADEQILTATGAGGAFSGLVLEIAEAESHGSYEKFKDAVLHAARPDLTALADGRVTHAGAGGGTVGIQVAATGLPLVWRDAKPHDWKNHWAMYRSADHRPAPIFQGWQGGAFRVQAGGHTFAATLSPEFRYHFENK
jgi:hypothetical protein